MKLSFPKRHTVALLAVAAPLAMLFGYVALRSGPLAPIPVTATTVQARSIAPALSGIGTVQARHIYKIGPTIAGRVKRLDVDVGDSVAAGQSLGEMDPVDLDERMRAQLAAIAAGEAALKQVEARQVFAQSQARRYEQLFDARGASEESRATKRQELSVANAALVAARADIDRMRAELQALRAQRGNLILSAPVAGLVVARAADPGTTIIAGQAVIEMIDPATLWIEARFDQIGAEGLAAGLPARIELRSLRSTTLAGAVLRVEPRADAITEETLAKLVFDELPNPLPPLGELADVTVQLPALPAGPTIPNAAIRTVDGERGVWKISGDRLVFASVMLGRSDLDGQIQTRAGLEPGDQIVVYSDRALGTRSTIEVVERIAGAPR